MVKIICLALFLFLNSKLYSSERISIFASGKVNHKSKETLPEINKTYENPSAYQSRVFLENVDFSKIPKWNSYEQILEAFVLIRDIRNLNDPKVTDFKRRIPWLFYQDGCFTRAGVANTILQTHNYPEIAQFFVFGALNLKKYNYYWTYHVAPAVQLHNEIYILDPAINPFKPLLLEEWFSNFVVRKNFIEVSICKNTTWGPNMSCTQSENNHIEEMSLEMWNKIYWLPSERKFLGDRADYQLGDYPPWIQ